MKTATGRIVLLAVVVLSFAVVCSTAHAGRMS